MKRIIALMLVICLMGCITTKTDANGTVTVQQVDQALISSVITNIGPAALPMIQAYTQAYLEYKAVQESNKLASQKRAAEDKLDLAKQVLQAARDAKVLK